MSITLMKPLLLPWALLILLTATRAQETVVKLSPISQSEEAVLRQLPDWRFTTKAYRKEAVRLMLKEANRVAGLLPLNEHLPIRDSDLAEWYVGPPTLVCLGWVATTNYNYIFDRKFCALTQRDAIARFYEAKAKYSWPMDRMDKNGAFQIATQLMAAVNIDVARLNREFPIEITTPETEGFIRKHFFPHYWVNWLKGEHAVAFIEFVVPTRSILQLRVEDTDYILRDPIAITNLAALLDQTNAPTKSPPASAPRAP